METFSDIRDFGQEQILDKQFLPKRKLLLLDQNAISKLALSPFNEWLEILELLQSGVKNQKILCPTDDVWTSITVGVDAVPPKVGFPAGAGS